MKHGNFNFCRWLYLCLLCLAVFSPLTARADESGSISYNFVTYPGDITRTITGSWSRSTGSSVVSYTMNASPDLNTAYAGWYTSSGSNVSAMQFGGSFTVPYGSGSYEARLFTGSGTFIGVIFSYPSAPASVDNSLTLTLANNTTSSRTFTVSVTGGTSYTVTVSALGSSTDTHTISGAPGTSVTLSPSGSDFTYNASYDPLVIGPSGSSITRDGKWGVQGVVKHLRFVLVSYSTTGVNVPVLIDGTSFGSVTAGPSSDGVHPTTTTIDLNLTLPPTAQVGVGSVSPHTLTSTRNQLPDMYVVTVVVDKDNSGTQAGVTVGAPLSDGTQRVTTTDPTTGTATVDYLHPNTPTNTDTSPSTVLGGSGGTGTGSSGTTVTNGATGGVIADTSNAAASAAAQESAGTLKEIADNTKQIADNSNARKADDDSAKSALNDVLNTNPDTFKTATLGGAQASATSAQSAASAAISAHMGTPDATAVSTPSAPSPGTVDLNIGGGQHVTMQLNPFASDGPLAGIIATAAAFIKRLIAYALVFMFMREIFVEVKGVLGTAFLTGGYSPQTVDFIKSANLFGNSVGVPIAIVVRIALIAVIVTFVITAPALILAAVESGLPWSELTTIYHGGAAAAGATGGGMLDQALGYASYVLPWRLMLSLPLWYILVQNILFPLQMFWMMLFKFLG